MLPVSLDFPVLFVKKTGKTRETGNIGYTRGRQTKQENPEKLAT
jgi:hypothetical protein